MTQVLPSGPVRHIKQKQVDKILQLQELFHTKFLTADLLNELIASYVEAIECFDGFYAPMRKYFLSKIQFVLARPEIDTMLKKNSENDMVGMLRETIRMTVDNPKIDEGMSHRLIMQAIQAENKKSRQNYQKSLKEKRKAVNSPSTQITSPSHSNQKQTQLSSISESQRQQLNLQQRKKKIQLQMNVMKQVSENMKNIEEQVNQQKQKQMTKNKRINALMEQQNNSLEERLAMRKRAKNRKKSGDEKQLQEIKEVLPVIQKAELKQAQKEIHEAVERMTARLTAQRQGTNKGSTGLILTTNKNEQQKTKGRIKIKNQVREQDNEDQDLLAQCQSVKKTANPENKPTAPQTKTEAQNQSVRPSENASTARFTLGTQSGGRGRIKRRDTTRLDEQDHDELM